MEVWEALLLRAKEQNQVALLLSNGYEDPNGRFELLYGEGCLQEFFEPKKLNDFQELAFGHVGYHFKNELYRSLTHTNISHERWLPFYFFQPEKYYLLSRDGQRQSNFEIDTRGDFPRKEEVDTFISWEASETPESYVKKVVEIKEAIRLGVFYEMNFCQEFRAEASIDPYRLFWELNRSAPAPFACFYKIGNRYMIGGSPERFLQKCGKTLKSQPIKGTRKRSGLNDEAERAALRNSEKDLAENVMIVDLVRNDLSRVSEVGSVRVEALCEIYSYPTVHQMISTVASQLKDEVGFEGVLEALFPMGSMTGAPKLEVMKHIDIMETFQRELYSGSIGYFYRGDFDLNVVIRSVEYFQGTLLHAVGGAITFDSTPVEEFEECLTKAQGIRRLFGA